MGTRNSKSLKNVLVMPPPKGMCPECGQDHDPGWMHDVNSAIYWLRFIKRHDRRPRWSDAMAHCSPEIRDCLKQKMLELGIEDNSDWIPEDDLLGLTRKINRDEGFVRMVK